MAASRTHLATVAASSASTPSSSAKMRTARNCAWSRRPPPSNFFCHRPVQCWPPRRILETASRSDPHHRSSTTAPREDIRMCCFDEQGKPPANVLDMQLAAGLVGSDISRSVMPGLSQRSPRSSGMTKGETLTDWRRRTRCCRAQAVARIRRRAVFTSGVEEAAPIGLKRLKTQ